MAVLSSDPTNGTGNVEKYLVKEEESRRNLVGNDLGGVEVTRVEGEELAVLCGVTETELA